jgi:hypothetical protein
MAGPALAAGPPTIEAVWVENVTATSADLRTEIDPDGLAAHYHFEYLTEAAYLAGGESFGGAARAPVGTEAVVPGVGVAAFQHLAGLTPDTAYRYRVVTVNAAAETTIGPALFLATEQPTNVFPPIDGRGYALVSPPDKDGGSVGAPESIFGGGDFQAAVGGGSFTFSSTSSFGEAAGAPPASQYLSSRGEGGWVTRNLSAPSESGAYGDHPDGVPFRVFSPDLGRALMLNGARCAVEGTCSPSYSLWEGGFAALPSLPGLRLEGATADLRHAVFGVEAGLYEWSGGGLEVVSAEPGAALAAPIGAISPDGSRVYFTEADDLWLREGSTAPQLVASGGEFQAAGDDGQVAFYATEEAPGELHLFRYRLGHGSESMATGVKGVLGASEAGGTVYFQDQVGLERWSEGAGASMIVPGAAIAIASDYPPGTATARISPDGEHLAFLSAAAIPPFDNTDADTGAPDTELYLYGPPPGGGAPRLLCASCNPTGERPTGSASIPGAVRNGPGGLYRPRILAAGGNRVFFDSADRLVVPDTDARPDVYEWEAAGVGDCTRSPGCVGLISGGRGEGGAFLDASESGDDAFFLTAESLVGVDPGSIDVYDDRVGGGFPESEAPFICKGDACQALPGEPEDPTPGTLVPTSGNPQLKVEKLKGRRRCPKGKRQVRRHGKARCLRKRSRGNHRAHRHEKRRRR